MTPQSQNDITRTLILVTSDKMGRGDDDLGGKLIVNYLKNIQEMGSDLWRIVFLNSGVKLATEGSDVVPVLKEIEKDGVVILVCTTCLNHFELLEKQQVGTATNMPDIVNATQFADKVITL